MNTEPPTTETERPSQAFVAFVESQIARILKASRPQKCAHGNHWDDCGDCDHINDLAYDAARDASR
jgi:hypothetical protein